MACRPAGPYAAGAGGAAGAAGTGAPCAAAGSGGAGGCGHRGGQMGLKPRSRFHLVVALYPTRNSFPLRFFLFFSLLFVSGFEHASIQELQNWAGPARCPWVSWTAPTARVCCTSLLHWKMAPGLRGFTSGAVTGGVLKVRTQSRANEQALAKHEQTRGLQSRRGSNCLDS